MSQYSPDGDAHLRRPAGVPDADPPVERLIVDHLHQVVEFADVAANGDLAVLHHGDPG